MRGGCDLSASAGQDADAELRGGEAGVDACDSECVARGRRDGVLQGAWAEFGESGAEYVCDVPGV